MFASVFDFTLDEIEKNFRESKADLESNVDSTSDSESDSDSGSDHKVLNLLSCNPLILLVLNH